jgi:hypothetical protein
LFDAADTGEDLAASSDHEGIVARAIAEALRAPSRDGRGKDDLTGFDSAL